MRITQLRKTAYLKNAARRIANFLMIDERAIKFIYKDGDEFDPEDYVEDTREYWQFEIRPRAAIERQRANGATLICNIIPKVCDLFGLHVESLILCYPSGKKANYNITLDNLRYSWEKK